MMRGLTSLLTTLTLLFMSNIKRWIVRGMLCLNILQGRTARWLAFAGLLLLFCAYPQGNSQPSNQQIWDELEISYSNHLVDMAKSNITVPNNFSLVPDHPRPISFQPTTIKDIKSAHPGAGINLIEPPRPNNLGDARLSYPIEVPPGRNGMQPDITVQYDSSNGNGWLGLGWNCSVSEITIDTRWGVPRYDALKETETYMLDGEQLTPVAHRGSLQDRSVDKVFHTRVEGQFRRIIRYGDHPSNYWWEVTSKDGTQYFYGGTPESGGLDPEAVLANPGNGNIFRWMLCEVRDTWGNTIKYSYQRVSDYGVTYGVVPGWQIYPLEIRYTGFEGTPGPYSIRFIRDRDLPDYPTNRRPDVIINARSGFKMVTADLLKQIEVRLEDELVRRYDLEYGPGAFNKSLLMSITQFGSNGDFFHKHEFEYYDEISNSAVDYNGFDPAESWAMPFDNVIGIMPLDGGASALGGNPSIEGGGHLYVGFNPWDPTKNNSVAGGKVGYTRSDGDGILTLIDIDGDSLPDKVFEDRFGFAFRRNLSGPDENKAFGPKQSIPTLPMMLEESTDAITVGEESYATVVSFMLDFIFTLTTRPTYFKDINGDGFPDLVIGGMVLFNHPNDQGIPTFTLDSNDTPVPIGSGVVDAANLLIDFTDLFERRIDAYPLLDSVRRWVAPYSGVVVISGSVQLLEDPSQLNPPYPDADGVRVAIQHNDSELWYLEIAADDLDIHPANVDPFWVARNNEIFFRVQSVFDGAYDQVQWDPEIEYIQVFSPKGLSKLEESVRDEMPEEMERTNQVATGASVKADANLKDPYRFVASEDFTLAGRGAKTQMPYNGTVHLSGDLTKLGVTSDDITLQVVQNGTPVIETTMAWNETGVIPLMDDLDVMESDKLEFNVRVDSPIDVAQIEWAPEIVYVATDADVGLTDPYGNPTLRFNPPYDVDLYPEHDLTVPQESWVAPETGEVEVIPHLVLPPPIPPFTYPFDSELVLTVKRLGALVAKRVIVIENGLLPPPGDLRFSMDVVEDEEYFFDYSTRHGRSFNDQGLAARLTVREVFVDYQDPPLPGPILVPSDFHRSLLLVEAFPEPYRGWSVIAYNGNRDRANLPIDRASLVIDDSYRLDNATVYVMMPDPSLGQWRTPGDASEMNPDTRGCWVAPEVMSSSRLGMVNISVPRPDDFAGARAMPIMSIMEEVSVGGSIGAPGTGPTFAGSMSLLAESQGILDFLDMNGDLFPDIVGPFVTQYTTMTGGLEQWGRLGIGRGFVRQSTNNAWNFGVGFGIEGNPAKSSQSAKGDVSPSSGRHSTASAGAAGKSKGSSSAGRRSSGGKQGSSGKQGSQMAELGFGGKLARGDSTVSHDLVDINGDGLPDLVVFRGLNLMVALNVGYGFAPPEPWGNVIIDNSNSSKYTLEGSLGYNDGIYGIGGGASYTRGDKWTERTLVDINGDDLVDFVIPDSDGFVVALNTGAGFAGPVFWRGGCNDDIGASVDITVGGGAFFTIGIGPLCKVGCYIIINPGGFVNFNMSRSETDFIDVNGDGLADHVFSDNDGRLDVALNQTGRTNLLKTVIRPMGATISLKYQRDGNTMDYPPSRWNLSRVEIFDGYTGDGVDTMVTTYQYEGAVYNPNERESYGYRTVTEEHRDAGTTDTVYRTITRTYKNDNFYNKGLLERTVLQDAAGNNFIEQVNTYELIDIDTGAPIVFPDSTTATVFPQLVRRETYFYEGQPTAGKFTYATYRYDSLGNIIEFFDAGDTGAEDDLLATIDYFADLNNYIVGKPNSIVLSSNGIELRRCEATIETGTGAVRQVRRFLEDGQAAVTDLDYYPNGNLWSITGPPNLHGERYVVSLEYDPEVHTHIISIEDSFGYRSTTASYDLIYGQKDVITDINGNQIDYDYDVFGRLQTIRGPYQTGSTVATLQFEYHPEAPVPWALTRRIDTFRDIYDPIDTVTFADGLKRVLQTKKDATVLSATGSIQPEDVMIVSGRLTFDFIGRIIERYYPITEPLGTPDVFNAAYDAIAPTRIQYDVLDRVTKLTYPSGLFTTRNYGFGADRNSVIQFETLATDAKGIPKHVYSNVRGLITDIRQINKGGTEVIWTSYAYDPLRQLVRIEDDMHNVTRISYDNFGRRIAIDNPDTGETEKRYDLADNMIEKITANLRSEGQAIAYDYEFNRLKSITYPNFPDNNVSYDYGAPGAPFNRAGRITQVTDQSGTEVRFYGKLGEIVKEIKTVTSYTQGASINSPEIYTTEYTYDTWNRLQQLDYPDREELTYRYDSGGLLAFACGVKDDFPIEYIQQLWYDKFDQWVYLETSNGVVTHCEYNPVSRRLADLRAGCVASELFQNLHFNYDPVGNVLESYNDVPVPPPNQFGGPVLQNFGYDDLRRLVEATGTHRYAPNKTDRYSLNINYNTIHNITQTTQTHELVQPSGQPIPQHRTNYNWLYSYDGPLPHAATHMGDRTFTYDNNGNQTGWTHDLNGTRRVIVWDEENRIQSISDNGHIKRYKYNDVGRRVLKRGPQGETVYVNPYFTVRNRSVATKHIYAGPRRLASKLSPGYFNIRPPRGLPDFNFLYFYHPDHIGSSIYVTDKDGELYEHLQYFPFGEAWVEEKSNIQRTPYRFTANELEEETELYYYELRYYDPKTSVWQNPDDVFEYCLDGQITGGVYNPGNLNLYAYRCQNPLK